MIVLIHINHRLNIIEIAKDIGINKRSFPTILTDRIQTILAQDALQHSYDIFTMLCDVQNIVEASWSYRKISCANRGRFALKQNLCLFSLLMRKALICSKELLDRPNVDQIISTIRNSQALTL
ncbi:hypothetical protein AVEN_75578-1 [Araneus ventricosus]|uniref:Uncharacterized protein n=1 Tax=Araneus ventricosus TaxID=182803 RepID=A0A4Y2CJS0_ARAVE|nr:hypothetical protein AVEN_75578-1 [Araneus ventricosus]